MRWQWAVIAAMALFFGGIGMMATIPVGVSAADVEDQAQKIQNAAPDKPGADAVREATQYLEGRQRSRLTYMFVAYIVIWAALGGYMVSLARRQTRLLDELNRLQGQMGKE
ncbi:CcmD family protein [Candidatus Poribacteria bacterium]|nr:CcmD family protein [Candidatus Poribacteria bacterium]